MEKSIYTTRYARFCEKLCDARKDAGLTQWDVANRLRQPQSFVAKYEGGERRLDVVELIDIAKVIGFNASAMVAELEEE